MVIIYNLSHSSARLIHMRFLTLRVSKALQYVMKNAAL